MLRLEQAQNKVLEVTPASGALLSLSEILSCLPDSVLAETIYSPQDSPLFDNSAMDGFALRLEPDEQAPFVRQVIAEIPAGSRWTGELEAHQALRIMTGAEVPASANAVVPIEEVLFDAPDSIRIEVALRQGQHIRRQGEEFKTGELLLEAGVPLNPAAIGLLATVGKAKALVYRSPRVGIVATGSELLPPEAPLQPGKLRDANSYTLAACVQEAGAIPVLYGILPDQPDQIRQALIRAFAECDLVLSSGGVSVGDYDYVQDILLELGLQKIFWKVAIRPGKPVLFGTLQGKLLFGIPGNPASALTVFEVLVRPALRKMLGQRELFRPKARARLTQPLKASERLWLVRGLFENAEFRPLKGQSSSNLLTVARANALLAVTQDFEAGQEVEVQRLDI